MKEEDDHEDVFGANVREKLGQCLGDNVYDTLGAQQDQHARAGEISGE